MPSRRTKNYKLKCQECTAEFMALRPSDKFCSAQCREISKERNRDPARKRERLRLWGKKNYQHRRNYHLMYNYGITQEQYDELLQRQGGCCAVCLRPASSFTKKLAVDHNHKS